jgi:hypothetical protein
MSSIDMSTHEVNPLQNKTKSDIYSFVVLSNWTNIGVIVAEHVTLQNAHHCGVIGALGFLSSDRFNYVRDTNIR